MTEAAEIPKSAPHARIPLSVPDLRGNERAYLERCVADNWVSSAGPFVAEFEERMAALAGRAHGIAAVNGTAALHLALLAAGVRPGDRVIVPDWTFAATANAVYHAGAEPLFVDVTRETWTLDPALVEEALSGRAAGGRAVTAIVAVHALGHPADMDPISEIARRHGVPLIEDAAGAIGARHRGRPAGGLGDSAMFSFNGNKTVTAGGGGMVVTENADWAKRMRHLSTQARAARDYQHDEIGFNYRMTNVNAAIGLAQLERLDEMLVAKRRIAAAYDAALAGRGDLLPMPRADWAESGCWLYSVLTGSRGDAGALVEAMAAHGIEARTFWSSLSSQTPYDAAERKLAGVSEGLSGRVVSLPSSSNLSDAALARVLGALASWRGQSRIEAAWTSS